MQTPPRTLVWLASYPKSGNTWLRAFLANYLIRGEGDGPLPFEAIKSVSFGDSGVEPLMRLAGGRDPRQAPPEALVRLRTARLGQIATRGRINFVKTHNANIRRGGGYLIPAALTMAALYVIRDPRDMVLSYADHWGIGHDEAVRQIADPANRIPANPKTVTQFLGSWSDHVRSWTRTRDFRVLVLRYEDMLEDPADCFGRVVRHLGLPLDTVALEHAVAAASFGSLSALEAAQGFDEKGTAQERFFRKGTAGQWRDALAPDLAERIVATHGSVMRRHGYR